MQEQLNTLNERLNELLAHHSALLAENLALKARLSDEEKGKLHMKQQLDALIAEVDRLLNHLND